MNIIDLENDRISLIQKLNENVHDRIKLFLISEYFALVLSTKNKIVIEAFTTEFIEHYAVLLQNTIPNFVHPKSFSQIIILSKELVNNISIEEIKNKLSYSIEIFSVKFEELRKILNGEVLDINENKIKFPVIEKFENENILNSGFIETISISLKFTNEKNKFIIIPSNANLEEKLSDQINISWNSAINFLQSFMKSKSKFYEVIIQFDQKSVNYIGNSFGTAITVLFIQKLLDLSNADYTINIKPGIVITGGINKNNEILSVSSDVVEKKTELVFFSAEQTFVVPKKDEIAAQLKLVELQKEFPKRKISIIAVESLEDLFNRRNLVEIKKLSLVKKTSRKIRRNWKAVVIILPLILILGFLLYRDWDDNPAILESSENSIFVKNKSGKVLWSRKMGYNPTMVKYETYFRYYQKLVDINNDGINEVILANEDISELNDKTNFRRIICLDKNKNEIWNYNFKDTITTNLQKMNTIYSSFLIDTVTIQNKKSLVCVANNIKSYSSAIFQLDLKTGKRVNSTLWNAGFITNGIIFDFDGDGKKELIGNFVNNGFEQAGIMQIEIEKLSGQCPTTSNYQYKYLPIADLEEYILFPKTDYTHYINQRIEGILCGGTLHRSEENKILVNVEMDMNKASIHYYYNYLLNNFEIVIGNEFRVMRDSLVVQGKLKPPLTDTEEYCNLLNSQIKYWNGEEFVYRRSLD
ncbi:MAG: hypothetical protein IPM32_16480 [Ignavibacteriae bacterium]|nr:hypothetical protein [Ignavibacteriota bacterium]